MTQPLLRITEVAEKLALPARYYETMGAYGAKMSLDLLTDPAYPRKGKVILVTATTPTTTGEGKTVTAIGLVQGLERLGKKALITSREPSLGPLFGMKGGAAGGGLSQVEPAQKINLHFNGDFHAITSAHNLLAALIDAHIFHGNDLDLDPGQITWPRAMDMNDRALRRITVDAGGKGQGANRATGFVITAASEVMAIMGLSKDREDLRRRLGNIVVGASRKGNPVRASDLQATGAMMAILNDALLPNLVQTTEGTPALVHTGPFGNVAHGTSSVISQDMGLRLADYVVNEAGFATDLGAEKYIDLVMQESGIHPSVAVLVTTVQGLRAQGYGDLEGGYPNLDKHLDSLRKFGLPIVVALNRFPHDEDADLEKVLKYCTEKGVACAITEPFTKGGAGALELAAKVVEAIDRNVEATAHSIYALSDSLEEKITKVATEVYGASGVALNDTAKAELQRLTEWGFSELPICIAKTQYSLSDNPKLLGAPSGWVLQVMDLSVSAGAGFIVVVAGNMMLMPGLPKVARAVSIDVTPAGEIVGI